jgi:hypothetical protein
LKRFSSVLSKERLSHLKYFGTQVKSQQNRTSLIKDIPGLIEEFEDIEENEPEIISQFKIRNKIYYKVKYGNGETVDEPKIQFIKRFPTIIEEYEQSLTEES